MRCAALLLFCALFASAIIVDQIAITVDNDLIKDSDIKRDLLATQLLNGDPPDISNAARKKDAAHLIDQIFIRHEIRNGDYPIATIQDANEELAALVKERFKTQAQFDAVLKRYQLTEADLREQFRWQLTVLRFIDERFRPAVLITDAEVDKYYRQHLPALRQQNPKGTEADLKENAKNILTDEQVNKLLFAWLDERRNNSKIQYLEPSLA